MRRAEGPAVAGFSLPELLVVLVIVAVLAIAAWPSFQAQHLQSRRADAHVALLQLQTRQLRWRADHPGYASAAELDAPARSPGGHYRLEVLAADPAGFTLQAEAEGPQRADRACALLQLKQEAAHTTLSSHAADGTHNPEPANRRCWRS